MQVLTLSGYVDAATLQVGDSVCAFDENTGAPIVNQVETVAYVDLTEWQRWWKPMVDSGELADYPPFAFYEINGAWTLNSEQSIWRNGTNVCHVRDLVVGDTIYDDADSPVVITSVDPVTLAGWYRFDISGDHSYIADGLTLHNASRFWVGGTGTWDSSTTTHWAASTGGAGGQSVPGSADSVTIDANSGAGTITVNFGGSITLVTLSCGLMGMTLDNSANNNNFTFSGNFSGSGSGTRTIKLGSATYTMNSTAINTTPWSTATTTGLTLQAGTSIIDFSGAVGPGTGQSFLGGAQTYSTVRISGARVDSGLIITNSAGTIGTLDIEANASVSLSASLTITNLTVNDQLLLSVPSGGTLTLTNAPTITGSISKVNSILNGATADNSSTATITCSSGTFSGAYVACQGMTFSGTSLPTFTNSYDLGKNSPAGIITAPSAGGPVGQFISAQRGTPY